jgi:3-phosphoglycerate kinase
VAARLEELLAGTNVAFAEDCLQADAAVAALLPGQILLLENVRFYKNESSKKEDERVAMARKLATYGDVFVSDAFGTAHRNSATSTCVCGEFRLSASLSHTLTISFCFFFYDSDGSAGNYGTRSRWLSHEQGNYRL